MKTLNKQNVLAVAMIDAQARLTEAKRELADIKADWLAAHYGNWVSDHGQITERDAHIRNTFDAKAFDVVHPGLRDAFYRPQSVGVALAVKVFSV